MMRTSVWGMTLMSGLGDAINPCIFIAGSFFLLYLGWLANRSLGREKYVLVFLILTYHLMLVINLVSMRDALFVPVVHQLMSSIFIFLGFLSIVVGVVFISDWYRLIRNQSANSIVQQYWRKGSSKPVFTWIVTILLAIVLSCLASVWPMNYYMGIIGNGILIPGQLWRTILLMAVYTVLSMFPLFVVLILMRLMGANLRLFYAISAAFFISAGVGAIYIFNILMKGIS